MRRFGVLIMILLMLVACGKKDDNDTEANVVASATLPEIPTLPPQATVDPLASPAVIQGNTVPTLAFTARPTSANIDISGQPTLPPVATSTPSPTRRPSSTPEPTATSTFVAPTEPAACTNFRDDTERNLDSYDLSQGLWPAIYWFAPQGENLSYFIKLFDTDFVEIHRANNLLETEYSFDPEIFTKSGVYYWLVSAYAGGVSLGCYDLDGEMVISVVGTN